jgi:uncharacterized protein YyaL (SSP411 family)
MERNMRLSKIRKSISILVILTILTAYFIVNACGDDTKQDRQGDMLNSIVMAADYATDVLLDENGKSRCDYQMVESKWYDYEPPWHTGQIIYALTEAFDITKNQKYLDAAIKAGEWWISLEIKDHPKLKGMLYTVHGDNVGEVIVFATMSDGSAGLYRLSKKSGDKKYADVATQAGDWMMKNMYEPEHRVFYDCVDPKTGEVLKEGSPFWPEKTKQELFDVARPNNEGSLFKDMYEHTGNDAYKEMFIELCESLLDYQGEEGLWMDFTPNNKETGSFHPRFNLWYAESLLEGYDLTGKTAYLEAALKTARFYTKFQDKDGTIFYRNFIDGTRNENSVCGSTVAFAGIIWLRLLNYGVGEEFKDNIERSVHWLLKNQYSKNHGDPNLAGGFINTRLRHKKGKLWITNRDVGTSFGIRFLADYYRHAYK